MKDGVKDWRLTISLPPELEDAIVKLRQTDEFCRCSYGELVRRLIETGLKAMSKRKR